MPASNLNNNSTGIAAGYGVGAGLQSFVQAYQQALNYQLEKQRAASQADYQNKMAQVAQSEVGAKNLAAVAPYAQYGADTLNEAYNKLGAQNQQPDNTPQTQQASLDASLARMNAGPNAQLPSQQSPQPGLMGPPAPQQLPSQAPQTPGLTTQQKPGAFSNFDPYARLKFEKQLEDQQKVKEMVRANNMKMDGTVSSIGPNGEPVTTFDQSKMSPPAKAALLTSQQGNRSAPGAVREQFLGSDENKYAVKTAQDAKNAMELYNNGNDPALASLYMKSVGGDENSIKDDKNTSAQMKDAIYKSIHGGATQDTRNVIISALLLKNKAATESLYDTKPAIAYSAKLAGDTDTPYLKTPALDKTYAAGGKILAGIKQPSAEPSQGGLSGLISKWANSSGGDKSFATPNPQPNNLSAQDQAAINWAKNNPKAPQSAKILQLHGM